MRADRKRTEMDSMTFITEAYSEDTGGGLVCDVLVLADRTVLVIGRSRSYCIGIWKRGKCLGRGPSRGDCSAKWLACGTTAILHHG